MAKGLVRTIQCISLWGTPVKPSAKIIFLSCRFFPPHFLGPQMSPGQNVGQRGPDLAPGPKNQKDARRNMVQNPAGINSNGARRSKLWPKTILGEILEFWAPFGTFWGTFGIPFWYLLEPCMPQGLYALSRVEAVNRGGGSLGDFPC